MMIDDDVVAPESTLEAMVGAAKSIKKQDILRCSRSKILMMNEW